MAVAKNPHETRMQRHLLQKFLDAEVAIISLSRPAMVTTAAGGKVKGVPVVLSPQEFRLVPFKKRLTAITRDTPDGNIVKLEYVLIGKYNADVLPGDYFLWDTGMYDVISLEPNRSYRTAANIMYRGLDNAIWG